MDAEPTECPDADLLQLIISGRAPADRGEALARHVESCPDCISRISMLRMAPPIPKPMTFNRPWKAYSAFAAVLIVVSTAIYCVIEQFHRDR